MRAIACLAVLLGLIAACAQPEVTSTPEPPSPPATVSATTAVTQPISTSVPEPTQIPTDAPTATTEPVPETIPTIRPTPTVAPPSASFSVDVEAGTASFIVNFTNSTQGPVALVKWDFGDGQTSTDESPTHRYTTAGRHTVSLEVSGPGGSDTSVMADLITVEPGPAVSIEVSPSMATLAVQESAQFTAVAQDEFGNSVPEKILWTVAADGGSIDENGLFIADTAAGSYTNTVKASLQLDTGELTDTGSVTVKPGPLAEARVEPAGVALDLEATQIFTFMAIDEFGNQISDVLSSWTVPSGAGAIDAAGVLTTGTRAGLFLGGVQVDVVKEADRVSAATDIAILPDPLDAIDVQPSNIFVERGTGQRLTASGMDQYGNTIPGLAFLWESTGGRITQNGFFTAGEKFGVFEVSVEATFKASRGFRLVEVAIPFSCSYVSEIPTLECEALVALFNATDGTNWTNNSGWLESDIPCSWHGVVCSAGHVRLLVMNDNQIIGSIPVELGNLSNLASLVLTDNQLSGSIPVELGDLSNLTTLDLSGNRLRGSIPVELANLSNLINLRLCCNGLSGSIPAELGNLSMLLDLHLGYGNQLSGSIPVELANLSNLKHLTLIGNQLSGNIPVELANLSNLQDLELSDTLLFGPIPQNLTKLNLARFVFNDTALCEPPEAGFQAWLASIDDLQTTGVICN